MMTHTLFCFARRAVAAVFLIAISFVSLEAQNVFKSIEKEGISFSQKAIYEPQNFAAFQAVDAELSTNLRKTIATGGSFEMPMPSGQYVNVTLKPYRVAESGFYKKYPSIQTFSFSDRSGEVNGFGSMSEKGLHVVGRCSEGQFYIDPTDKSQDKKTYAAYYRADYQLPEGVIPSRCEKEEILDEVEEPGPTLADAAAKSAASKSRPPLRQYDFAVATTGEYAQYHGGTKADVAAELVNLMVRVNEVMRREYSVEYILIEETDTLFFLDPETDGFTNGNTSVLINQVDVTIGNLIDVNAYDLGHILCTQYGGLASVSSVCSDRRKRNGVSCGDNPIGDRFYVELVCHEVGHQMGSRHSFNHCRGVNESLLTGFEPGSGTTIMAYSGLCGGNNVSTVTSPYYNIGSIEAITAYMHEGNGARCAEETERPGQIPTLSFDFDTDNPTVIPGSTPFELTANVTADTMDLLYCWEQYDAVPFNCNVNNPTGNCPLFRSYEPTPDPTRVFPRIDRLINGTSSRWEKLPDYDRSMQFMCTLRDWDPEGGTLDWDLVQLDVAGDAGPFTVGDISGTYEVGDQIEINWDVAQTDQAPVSCGRVDIYMSEDGGFTYPHLLAESVPNSGTLTLNAPNIPTDNAKIKVKGHDNFFFNISGSTFGISAPSAPTFSASYPAFFEQVCLPEDGVYRIETQPYLGFDEDVLLSDVQGLPAGASWEANPAVIEAGEPMDIIIDYGEADKQAIQLQAILSSPSQDTVRVALATQLISNDFEELELIEPALNQANASPVVDFAWTEVEDALSYRIELSFSPSFDDIETSVETEVGQANFNTQNGYQLETGVSYYWRVIPINECGDGTPSDTYVLRTAAVVCDRYTSIDVPKSILPTSNAQLESVINIEEVGVVESTEIRNLRGVHPFVGEIRARLQSPSGTEVRLFTEECFNLSDFNANFSDLAPTELQCPLTGGDTYQPQDELAVLSGESTQGIWKLIIEDRTAGNGGQLRNWEIELCGALSASAPAFSRDTLYVSRGGVQFLKDDNLLAEKQDLAPYEITYTIVDAPTEGLLTFGDDTLRAGATFTQDAINKWWVRYTHNGSDADRDFITYVIEDADGGWLGLDTLPIKVDAVLKAEEAPSATFQVYPNPTSDVFFVYPPQGFRDGVLEIRDSQGRALRTMTLSGAERIKITEGEFVPGLYYVQLIKGEKRLTQKLIIQ
jgi:subtilisin-like proprotein convertase family protein